MASDTILDDLNYVMANLLNMFTFTKKYANLAFRY